MTHETRPQRERYEEGDFVVYRDPVAFLRGKPGHTVPCRIDVILGRNDLHLKAVGDGRAIHCTDPAYLRKVSAEQVMDSIDAAPLDFPGEFLTARDAWIEQQRRPDGAA